MKRCPSNPILTRCDLRDMPPAIVDPSSVFNPGAVRVDDRVLLLLRVQTRGRETFLVAAESRDGIDFEIRHDPVRLHGIEQVEETIYHVYDPRITVIAGLIHVMFAADTDAGCRLGVATTPDFERFDLVGLGADPGVRNGVLFPERHDGRYLRLDRPNEVELPGGGCSGNKIRLSASEDLVHWQPVGEVIAGRPHYWDELIGSGPPPLRTPHGWLHLYHGVATHFAGANIYQAGIVLLDLDDPTRVVARGRNNILEPREPYEMTGQVPNVVFPTGLVELNHELLVYYGAADTCVCLATTSVAELIEACHE